MPTYQNPIDDDERLTLAETDKPLAETLNPAFRYALFSQIAKGGKSTICLLYTSDAADDP